MEDALQKILIFIVPAMLGIILHEVAHGWAAYRLGDPTARILGRLTLNPLPHIDPMGLLVFVLTSISSSFVFGWAKPVPVDPRYFRYPEKGMMLVAFAGPGTNFCLAFLFTLLLWVGIYVVPASFWLNNPSLVVLLQSCKAGILINLGLAWLNLLPIPPLDGSKIVSYFLPLQLKRPYLQLERYGFVLLLVLLFVGALNAVLKPLLLGSFNGLLTLFNLT